MNLDSKETQHMAEVMANEKGLSSEQVLAALNKALQKATKNEHANILELAATRHLSAQTKHHFLKELDSLVLQKKVAEILNRSVALMTGLVRQVRPHHLNVEAEGFTFRLSKEQLFPRDYFKIGEKVSFVPQLEMDNEGIFSGVAYRNDDIFVEECIRNEISSIENNDITIEKIVREPGKICQIALSSQKHRAVLEVANGIRGIHNRTISTALKGEKIEFLIWEEEALTRLVNGMQNIDINRITIDDDTKEAVLVLTDDTIINDALKLQTKLAGFMADMSIILVHESEMAARADDHYNKLNDQLTNILGAQVAHNLLIAQFESMEDVAWRPISEWPPELKNEAHQWAKHRRKINFIFYATWFIKKRSSCIKK